jgi:alkyl sulfatase BDS1-like metallo-beta-lactamase superfamily hydrolase
VHFTDSGRDFLLMIKHGVLNYRSDRAARDPDVALRLSRLDFIALLTEQVELAELRAEQRASVEGSLLTLRTFGGLFDDFAFWFPIVTP